MASTLQGIISSTVFAPACEREKTPLYGEIYSQNCDRIYSLAFYVTDNELDAEQLSTNTFLRVFAGNSSPRIDQIDQAFLAEVRELSPIGVLTLNNPTTAENKNIRGNIKRVHLERAVVQLPTTEKLVFLFHDVEGYEHARIGHLLGISEDQSRLALHQARIQIRDLVAQMM